MRKQLNLEDNNKLKDLFITFGNVFGATLSTVINKSVNLEIRATFEDDLKGMKKEFLSQTVITISDPLNNISGGLFMGTKDVTAFADLMMMGPGNGVEELDDDMKDAVKELISQGVSAFNVPFNETFGKKSTFEVGEVMMVDEMKETNNNFISQDYWAVYDGGSCNIRFFISQEIKKVIDADDDFGSNFDFAEVEDFDLDKAPKKTHEFQGGGNIDLLMDVDIPVSVRIGSTKMFLKELAGIGPGNIIELDQYADEPVEILINNKPIARGEVVIVDGFFGVRIIEIISKEERLKKLRDS